MDLTYVRFAVKIEIVKVKACAAGSAGLRHTAEETPFDTSKPYNLRELRALGAGRRTAPSCFCAAQRPAYFVWLSASARTLFDRLKENGEFVKEGV